MQFIVSEGTAELEAALKLSITEACNANESVGLLIPGGSNISIAVRVLSNLDSSCKQKLHLILSDERYGQPGFADSNQTQYVQAGLDLITWQYQPILEGKGFEDTIAAANLAYCQMLDQCSYVIGFFGMGTDGHIAGVLPNSPGVSSTDYAIGYQAKEYQRITPTLKTISSLNEVFLGVFGVAKAKVIKSLKSASKDLSTQPAQILHRVDDCKVYTDIKETDT